MSHARRYHESGVGSRTGMRVAADAVDLDDFFRAGRRALIGSPRDSLASRSSMASSSNDKSFVLSMHSDPASMKKSNSALSPRSTATHRKSTLVSSSDSFTARSAGVGQVQLSAKRLRNAQNSALADITNASQDISHQLTSPSPWIIEGQKSLTERRGLNAGLEARRNARMKQVQKQQQAHRIASLDTHPNRPSVARSTVPHDDDGDTTGLSTLTTTTKRRDWSVTMEAADESQADENVKVKPKAGAGFDARSDAGMSDVDGASTSSWPEVQDLPPDDDIEAFDGSASHNRRQSIVSVDEQENGEDTESNATLEDIRQISRSSMMIAGSSNADLSRSRGLQSKVIAAQEFPPYEEEPDVQADSDMEVDERINRHSSARDDSMAESGAMQSIDQTQTSTYSDQAYNDEDPDEGISERSSEAEESVPMSEEEEEAESTMNAGTETNQSETFDFPEADQDDDDDDDDDDDITPTMDSFSYANSNVELDTDGSTKRKKGVLSERDSNVSLSSTSESKTKYTVKKRRNHDEDGDYGERKNVKQGKIRKRNGELVERVPSAQQRRLTGVESGEDGVRRGTRYRYKPLEYWRGERARYGRLSLPKSKEQRALERGDGDDSNVGDDTTIDADAFESHVTAAPPPVAVLKEIIRIPRAEGEGTFSGMKIPTKRSSSGEKGAASGGRKRGELDPTQPTRNPEDGWDKDTATHVTVYDAASEQESSKQVVCTSEQLRPRMAVGCTFGFEKVFVIEDFMATGVLFLLVDGEKPMKNSKDNYYTFVVLEGSVRVRIHQTEFVVAPQGMFFIPRGNDYAIKNIAKRVARLAFTQAKSPHHHQQAVSVSSPSKVMPSSDDRP